MARYCAIFRQILLLALLGRSDQGGVQLTAHDWLEALRAETSRSGEYDRLDAVLIESATQLAQPKGSAVVGLELDDASQVMGKIVWADAAFLKIRNTDFAREEIVSKRRVRRITKLEGTDQDTTDDVMVDPWAQVVPGLA